MAFEFTYYFLRGAMHTRSPTHDVANVVGWLVGWSRGCIAAKRLDKSSCGLVGLQKLASVNVTHYVIGSETP